MAGSKEFEKVVKTIRKIIHKFNGTKTETLVEVVRSFEEEVEAIQ